MTRPKQEQPVWTTRDGRTLKIAAMETGHIESTIAFLSRGVESLESRLYALDVFDDCFSHYETKMRRRIGWAQKKIQQMRAELTRRDVRNLRSEKNPSQNIFTRAQTASR